MAGRNNYINSRYCYIINNYGGKYAKIKDNFEGKQYGGIR